jgi:hypothetical protein
MRLMCGPWFLWALAVPVILSWGEAFTARNLRRGVKRRAEQPVKPTFGNSGGPNPTVEEADP